jgi:hypothetical protein
MHGALREEREHGGSDVAAPGAGAPVAEATAVSVPVSLAVMWCVKSVTCVATMHLFLHVSSAYRDIS